MTISITLGISLPTYSYTRPTEWLLYTNLELEEFYTDSEWIHEYQIYFDRFLDDIKLDLVYQNYPNALQYITCAKIDILETYNNAGAIVCIIKTFWLREFQRQCKYRLKNLKKYRQFQVILKRQLTGKFML